MLTTQTSIPRATTSTRPVFYRSAVKVYLLSRLPSTAPIDALTDDILRDVCDPEVSALFGRPFNGFRDRLLSVTRLGLRLLPASDGTDPKELGLQPPLWPLPPASEEEEREFDRLYASALLAEASDGFARTVEGRSPELVRAVHLRYHEGMSIARTAEETGLPVEEVSALLQRARARGTAGTCSSPSTSSARRRRR